MVKKSVSPTHIPTEVLARAWDGNAPTRLDELQQGDPAYAALIDLMIEQVEDGEPDRKRRILDVGCGLGFLALALAQRGHDVTAIDPSKRSIKLARATHPALPNLQFENSSLEDYATTHPDETFDSIIANMVLHSV